jgi:hypothetical protein
MTDLQTEPNELDDKPQFEIDALIKQLRVAAGVRFAGTYAELMNLCNQAAEALTAQGRELQAKDHLYQESYRLGSAWRVRAEAAEAAKPSPELIGQRADDDCTICAIAMATGLPYERVMEVAVNAKGGYRYQGIPGTMSPKGVLMDLGYEAQRAPMAGIGSHVRQRLLWGRRAILSLPSLNGHPGHHDVYWDGRRIRDPSNKRAYMSDALAKVAPLWAVVLDERA